MLSQTRWRQIVWDEACLVDRFYCLWSSIETLKLSSRWTIENDMKMIGISSMNLFFRLPPLHSNALSVAVAGTSGTSSIFCRYTSLPAMYSRLAELSVPLGGPLHAQLPRYHHSSIAKVPPLIQFGRWMPQSSGRRKTKTRGRWKVAPNLVPIFDTVYVYGRNPANQLRLVVYPTLYKVLYIPGGAGFLPSTVVWLLDVWGVSRVCCCQCTGRVSKEWKPSRDGCGIDLRIWAQQESQSVRLSWRDVRLSSA